MTIKRYAGDKLVGLSSDTKPTNIPDGATFYESDTLTSFLLEGGSWSAISASYINPLTQSVNIDGDLTVTGILTAQEFYTEFVSSSIIYESGSTKFGDSADDTHQFTGSLSVDGTISGSTISGSFVGDGSGLTNIVSASFATTASYVEGSASDWDTLANKPAGLVSSSGQVDYTGLSNIPSGIVSSSGQVSFTGITDVPSGLVSSSGQVSFDGISDVPVGLVSSSTQVDYTGLSNIPSGIVSSSQQINTGSFSGSFVGDGSGLTGIDVPVINNDADNRIVTAQGDGDLNAEANLTFDGTALSGSTGTLLYFPSSIDGNVIGQLGIDYLSGGDPQLRSRGGSNIYISDNLVMDSGGQNIQARATYAADLRFQHKRTADYGFAFDTRNDAGTSDVRRLRIPGGDADDAIFLIENVATVDIDADLEVLGTSTLTDVVNIGTALDLPDNVVLRFGTADDMQIYHNGTDNIFEVFNGDFVISGSGTKVGINTKTPTGVFEVLGGETDTTTMRAQEHHLYSAGSPNYELRFVVGQPNGVIIGNNGGAAIAYQSGSFLKVGAFDINGDVKTIQTPNPIMELYNQNQAVGFTDTLYIFDNKTNYARGAAIKISSSANTAVAYDQFGLDVSVVNQNGNAYAIYSRSGSNYFNDEVGIGTASPTHKLEIVGNVSASSYTGSFYGDGSQVTGVVSASYAVTASYVNPLVQDVSIDGDLTVTGILTAQEFHTEFVSSSIIYESGSTKFGDTLDDKHEFTGSLVVSSSNNNYIIGGNVGIDTTSPVYILDVTGTIRATDDVIVTSDIRLKNELPDIIQGLETVDKMRPIKYTLKDDKDENPKIHLGFSAQELLDIVPEVVNSDEEGYHSVSYGKLVPVLVKAIQELTEEVRELKKKTGE